MQYFPSYELNIKSFESEGGCFPDGFIPMEATSRGLALDVHLT
jgi:hypothetical protein